MVEFPGGNPTANFEAYDLYLRAKQSGNRFSESRNPDDLNLAIELLDQAVRLDAGFALA